MTVPVVIVAVFMRPVTLVYMPPIRIVIVVGMRPIGASIGRPAPLAAPPHPTATFGHPITINPHITWPGDRRRGFIAKRRRRSSDCYSE